MMTIYHNSFGRRVVLTLLAAILVFGLGISQTLADGGGDGGGDCGDACQSPNTAEIHTMPDGMNPEDCPKPVPLFCYCPADGCDSATVFFTDWSLGYIDTWEWDFGDPASGADNYSGEEYPSHFYGSPGTYTVTLTVTGCGGTMTKTRTDIITIRTSPTADFVADPLEGCAPLTVSFTSLSTYATWWGWNFGDPASGLDNRAYGPDPVHVYNDPGVYSVRLIVLNDCGKDTTYREEYITVYPGPTADFEAVPHSGQAPLSVDFTDLSTSHLGLTTWLWDFGDGISATAQNPTHVYTAPGYYTVVLRVWDPCGEDTATKIEYVFVTEECKIDFVGDPTEICEGETAQFAATSTGSCEISSWAWDFGDPGSGADNTGSGQQILHMYATAGVYTVTLTATDVTGDIVVTKTNYVTVNAGPTADFSATPLSGLAPLTVSFTDLSTSTLGIYSWFWDFGDGNSTGAQNPTHTYTAAGDYTITLTVVDRCGSDTATKEVYVHVDENCTVDFIGVPLDICEGETVDFSGTFTGICEISAWNWDFGDGGAGTGQYPQHTYNTAGVYTVTLTANVNGVDTVITRTDYVTVNAGPTADFSATPLSGLAPLTVSFTDMSTSTMGIGLYTWHFGDGQMSGDQNPTHTYTAAGDYTVVLEVQDRCGIDSKVKEIYIHVEDTCTVDFIGVPREICEGEAVDFTGTVEGECSISDWSWDFGDGATGTGQYPQHVYNTAGLYTVTLTATDVSGDKVVTKTDYITVFAGPTAAFDANPTSGSAPLTVSFTNHSISPSGGLIYTWHFGDGTFSGDTDPTHTYRSSGTYQVILEVQDRCGIHSAIDTIRVGPVCTVDFDGDRDICEGESADFAADWNGECSISSLDWDFGDGATGTGQYPQHTYNTAGLYTVTLTANVNGVDTVITRTDYVTVWAGPTAAFDVNPTSGDAPLTVNFTNHSVSPSNSEVYTWHFGDGNYSGDTNPTHTYASSGTYQVVLEVQDRCGIDGAIDTIRVGRVCTVDFDGDRQLCEGDTADFEADWFGECRIAALSWDFGDGGTGTGRYPQHTYNTAGVYTVALTANVNGIDTVITKTNYVTVNGGPTADFSATPLTGNAPLTVTFTDQSTSTMGIFSWFWNFGDGNYSRSRNPIHTYSAAGDYTVILRVEDACGLDTEVKEVYVHVDEDCEIDFFGEPLEICEGETVDFSGTVDGECEVDSWTWDFGDPSSGADNTGSGQYPHHIYNTAGLYTVVLTATVTGSDTVITRTDYVTVNPRPTADFSATPLSGLAPLTVDFTDLSTSQLGMTSWTWDFGDGTPGSTLQHPTHTYTDTGIFTVSLTVVDPCGEDLEVKKRYVYVNECDIDFFGEPLEICEGDAAHFTATSTGPCEIISWTWDFGDPASGPDNVGSGQYPMHTYNTAGVYTVVLTAVDVSGTQIVTKTDYVTVNAGPAADFHATPLSGMAPLTVDFTDLSVSTLGIVYRNWDFGDGYNSQDQDPTHTFADTGTFTVTLVVADECGEDTATTSITVGPAISITKLVDKVVAMEGEELLFTMTVNNAGDLPITSVLVVDTIPDSTGYVFRSVSTGGAYLPTSDLVMWSIPVVGPNSSVDVSFRVVLDGPFVQFPTFVSNQAHATIDDGGIATSVRTFHSNIVETLVNPGGSTGELEITKAVSATLASPGDPLTYTITVRNPGPTSNANNVVVLDAIPDSTTYVSGSVTGGGIYRAADDSLHWNLGTLVPFASRTVTFQVTVNTDCSDGTRIPNTAAVQYDMDGLPQAVESPEVVTLVSRVPLVVTKAVNRPSGMVGDLIRYTITVENFDNAVMENVRLTDTMPAGIFYVDGTSVIDGLAAADPVGNNPFAWSLGDLAAGGTFTVQYVGLIGASAHPAVNENIARALASQGGLPVHSNRAVANVYVVGYALTGSIRGRVIVDCDGDGIPDIDSVPAGMDVFLDDGSQSRVNNQGMFYFSTVRPGERVVALDERDLDGYYIPEDAQASVFVHVHEVGESYLFFRLCPEYPNLDISKRAAIVPTVKVTKVATLGADQPVDSLGVLIDYQIDIASNGLTDPTQVRVVDSFPDNMHLILAETETLAPRRDGNKLIYEVTAAQERLEKSVYYSLRDIAPGVRKFLNNRVHIESDLTRMGEQHRTMSSDPMEVAVGPMLMAPPRDIQITLTPALFKTSYAILRPEAIPELQAVADSIARYADAVIKVEGHTDLRPIHTEEFPSNWELGEARAKVVVDWLVANRGVARDRLEYESFAATRPVVVEVARTSPALQPNRRTEVIIKTDAEGFFAPAAIPADRWESSTSLALEPVNYDTLFEPAPTPMIVGLDDTWEIVLTIENPSAIAAENTTLTDIMPDGVIFVDGSATIDGVTTVATVDGQTISFSLVSVNPGQLIELRYRVTALPDTTPSGGGAASIEVMTSNNQPVMLKSNEVRFQ